MNPTLVPRPAALPRRAARRAAAATLRAASAALDRLAARVAAAPAASAPRRPPQTLQALEFHADAGAPEGALYVDGELVGYVSGVSRL